MISINTPTSSYNSRSATYQPAYADIEIVMMDPVVARRITTANLASITNLYRSTACSNAASFVTLLPPNFQAGAHSYLTHVQLKNVH